jgi:hypothetical protein
MSSLLEHYDKCAASSIDDLQLGLVGRCELSAAFSIENLQFIFSMVDYYELCAAYSLESFDFYLFGWCAPSAIESLCKFYLARGSLITEQAYSLDDLLF